jgi:hypothetical protein
MDAQLDSATHAMAPRNSRIHGEVEDFFFMVSNSLIRLAHDAFIAIAACSK